MNNKFLKGDEVTVIANLSEDKKQDFLIGKTGIVIWTSDNGGIVTVGFDQDEEWATMPYDCMPEELEKTGETY